MSVMYILLKDNSAERIYYIYAQCEIDRIGIRRMVLGGYITAIYNQLISL